MKRLVTILTISTVLLACSNKKVAEGEQINKSKLIIENYEPVREQLIEKELTPEQRGLVLLYKSLYDELIEFKDDEDFKQFGFSKSKYSAWLTKVLVQIGEKENERLKQFSLERRIFFGDLHSLGLNYVTSQGEETKQTREEQKKIYRALNPLKINHEIPPSGKGNYERIRKEYKLFGKWIMNIQNLSSNEANRYKYEIYRNGSCYIGFAAQEDWEYDAEILERKGAFFVIKGDNGSSRHGEYYRIDEDMNMILFDEDGELSEYGFTATKDF